MLISTLIFLFLTILISIFIHRRIKYFQNLNVPHEPINILFGNSKKSTLGKWSAAYDINRIYTKFKAKGLCAGFMKNFTPYLLPLSDEVLKQILITNFKNFRNNDFALDRGKQTVVSLNPFWMKNEKWKMKRSELSPAITVSRLKAMYPLIDAAAKEFSSYIKMKISAIKNPSMTFDLREITLKYSCNSIASTTYAINAQAYDENTSEILNYGREVWKTISSSTWLPSSPITREVNQYFIKLMNQAVQHRRYNNQQRNDLLNYFISLKDKRNFSDIETAAHAFAFFLDGFETSSLALCYVLYELSRNQDVQEKLRMEINENLDDDDKKQSTISIDILSNLVYLDQVFYEAIRLHPPLYFTTRVCNETTELNSGSEQKLLITNGTAILIPIYSIHRDPDYYENPNDFMPERFNEEYGGVKAFRDRCVLMPFGESARICLGKNLGTLQVKTAVVELLRRFKLVCCEPVSEHDLKIQANQFSNIPSEKIMVRFEPLET